MDWLEILSKWLPIGASVSLVIFVGIEIGLMRVNTTVDLMLRYEDRFNSPHLRKSRKCTARACLDVLKKEGEPNQNESRFSSHDQTIFLTILDFFESLGLLVRKARIKPDIVWSLFGDWIENYYSMFKEEISKMREKDSSLYENLIWLGKKMEATNRKRGISITDKDRLEFFELEANI